jgi:hypothetical protein
MRNLCLLGFFLLAASSIAVVQAEEPGVETDQEGTLSSAEGAVSLSAESPLQELFPRFKGRALVLDISARIIEEDETVVWNETHRKTTLPGRPVGIRLVGSNIVVAVQFTPYLRRGVQKFLVAQGQIWMDIPNQGMRYHTSMQTIPLEFDEPIYFFPLGPQSEGNAACIEVMLTLHPYEDN